MITNLRERHMKKILWTVIAIIVPAFILWGGSSALRNKKKNIIGTIQGEKITQEKFDYYVKMAQIYFIFINPKERSNISKKDIESLGLNFLMLLWKANKDNIETSDQEVINFIVKNFSPGGKFDKALYQRFYETTSRRYNLDVTTKRFEEYLREFLRVDKLFDKYIKIEVTDNEVKELYIRENQKAKLKYLFIPYEKFEENINLTAKEINEFYQKNESLFKREPKVNILYVSIDKNEFEQKISTELANIKTISELEEEFSLEVKESGLISFNDPINGIGWQPEINEIAFSLEKNKLSPPIKTEKGFLIMEKKDEKDAFIPPAEEIEEEIKEKLLTQKTKEEAKKIGQNILEKIKASEIKNLQEFANEKDNVKFTETDYYTYSNYTEALSSQIGDIVFSLKAEERYPELVSHDNGVYILQLKNIDPLDDKKFEEEKQSYYNKIKSGKEVTEKFKFFVQVQKEANLNFLP